MSVILGLGTARPEHCIEQKDAAQVARTFVYAADAETRGLPALFRRTKVERRASVLLEAPSECGVQQSFYPPASAADDRGPSTAQRMARFAVETPPLAIAAAHRAMTASQTAAEQITHLITVSCTGFFSPGIDAAVIRGLGLPPTVNRIQVGFMGCHGALNGLQVADALVRSNPASRVLLCAVELCSLHYQYGLDPQSVLANALFADGAAAAVIGDNFLCSGDRWQLLASGSYLFPDSENEMTWRIGDHGFEMTLSARVPDLIARNLRSWLEGWLAPQGCTLDRIGTWAVHPGGPRILSAAAEALGLRPSALAVSAEVLAECGNMSSPTILFILDRLRQQSAPRPCVALAFGPGLVAEAALFV